MQVSKIHYGSNDSDVALKRSGQVFWTRSNSESCGAVNVASQYDIVYYSWTVSTNSSRAIYKQANTAIPWRRHTTHAESICKIIDAKTMDMFAFYHEADSLSSFWPFPREVAPIHLISTE